MMTTTTTTTRLASFSTFSPRSRWIRAGTRLWHTSACIRGDNANRNKHLAARERHVAARIYYIPNAHTLDGRLKGCYTREEPRSWQRYQFFSLPLSSFCFFRQLLIMLVRWAPELLRVHRRILYAWAEQNARRILATGFPKLKSVN